MNQAASELLQLDVDGLQLTPGNIPTSGFSAELNERVTLQHHGFCFVRRRQTVWSEQGQCLVSHRSVHPPAQETLAENLWKKHLRWDLVYETMYPGYELGNGQEIIWAMDNRLRLAVDVSHIFIQLSLGVLTHQIWQKLQNYDLIAEIHVSKNAGKADTHRPLDSETFGLEWAKAKMQAGTPLVLESYFHRLTHDMRRAQIALLRC